MHKIATEAGSEVALHRVGEHADNLGARAELWVKDNQIFVDAPSGYCWAATETHALTAKVSETTTLLSQMNAGLETCSDDCVFHSEGGWKPIKKPVIRILNKKRQCA
jgi:hypothetical protein